MRGLSEGPPATGHRRQILAGIGLLVVAGGSFSAWQSAQARVYQTDVGEQKHLVLEDGSRVFLDTDTRISIKFDDTVHVAPNCSTAGPVSA